MPLLASAHQEEERAVCVGEAQEEPLRTEASKQIRSFPFREPTSGKGGSFSICSGPIPVLLKFWKMSLRYCEKRRHSYSTETHFQDVDRRRRRVRIIKVAS